MRDKMTVSKRILNIFTVAVVIALASCTFISKYIFDMRTPVVSVVKPASMEINGEMYYNKVIPKSAVFVGSDGRKYVYAVRERNGLFGVEFYLATAEITVNAENEEYAVMGGRNVSGNDNIVVRPDSALECADVVRIGKGNF